MNNTLRLPRDTDPWEEVLDRRVELLQEAAQSNHPFKSRLARMMLSRIGHEVGAWQFHLPSRDEDALMALQRASKGAQKEIKKMLSDDPSDLPDDPEEPA